MTDRRQRSGRQGPDFLSTEEHFLRLADNLVDSERELFTSLRCNRFEAAFKGRHFIVYTVNAGQPNEIDRVYVEDYTVTLGVGARCKLFSEVAEASMVVGYAPIRLFNHQVMVYLPLHSKLRWAATDDDIRDDMGSLAFPIAIRTRTGNTNVRGVTYCDTGPNFAKQFDPSYRG